MGSFDSVTAISLESIRDLRARVDRARALAAARFRDAFESQTSVAPDERWRAHLEIQAACLLETANEVRLKPAHRVAFVFPEPTIHQAIVVASDVHVVPPEVARMPARQSFYPYFEIERTPTALVEYWLLTSEMNGSAAWAVTRLIASAEEYRDALKRMDSPEIRQALRVSWLPDARWEADGTAKLDVTVSTRAGAERVERRQLFLDRDQEFDIHARDLIAEGRGGVDV